MPDAVRQLQLAGSPQPSKTSVMIHHRGASLSEQHTDLPIGHCTKQDLCHTSRYAAKSSPEIARYCILMPTARATTVSVATYAFTLKS